MWSYVCRRISRPTCLPGGDAARPPLRVVPANHCLVHDLTFTNVCSGCRADYLAGEEETA